MEEYNEDRGMKRERSWYQDGPNSKMPRPMPSTLRVLLRSIDAGGIIGKGGENIKRLRKKYECQVQLPDSSGNPERVLTVVGEQAGCVGVFVECLDKVKAEIRKRDSHAPIEVQILIPQPFMGTIIGTGGTKIKDLRKSTNANIKIFSEPMPFSNERSISLSGTEMQIIECVNFFLQEIGTKEPKEPIMLYDPSVADMPPFGFDGPGGPGGPPPFRGGRGGGRGRGGRGGGGPPGRGGGMSGRQPPHGQFSGHPPRRDNSFQPPPANNMPPPPQGPNQPPPVAPQAPTIQYPQPGSQVPPNPPSSFPSQPPPVPNATPSSNTGGSGNQQQPPPQFTGYPPPANSNYPPPPPVPGQPPPAARNPNMAQQQQPPPQPPPHSAPSQMPPGGPYSQPPPPVMPPSFNTPPTQPPSSYPGNYATPPQTGYVPPPKTSFDSGQTSYAPPQSSYAPPQTSYSTTQTTSYTTPASSYAQPPYAGQNFPPKPPQPPMGAFPPGQASNPPSSAYSMGYGSPYQQPPQPTFPAAAAAASYNSQSQQPPPTQSPTTEVQQTKQVTIPNEYSAAIVGPGGANLQQIKTQSGCNISMDDNVSGPQRIITIVGTARNIALAEQYMKDSVRQHHQV